MKKIITLLLTLAMVCTMVGGAFAAEPETDNSAALRLEISSDVNETEVTVWLQDGRDITNGRLTVTYPADGAQLLGYEKTDAYALSSINTRTAGEIGFAWVGSDLSANKTLLLTLRFRMPTESENVTFAAEAGGIYAASTAVTVADGSAVATGWSNPFADIDGHWARGSILTVAKNGLFNGVTSDTFVPDESMTRAMFVTVLHRAAGAPEADTSANTFADVGANEYYTAAVAWAVEKGIIEGVSATRFAPEARITRQEMMTMLCRYAANVLGLDTSASTDLSDFTDCMDVAAWAKAAVRWAVAEGILEGYPDGTLLPLNEATRAEAAAIFCRFLGL